MFYNISINNLCFSATCTSPLALVSSSTMLAEMVDIPGNPWEPLCIMMYFYHRHLKIEVSCAK